MTSTFLIQTDTLWSDPLYILPKSSVVVFPNVTLTIRGQPESPVKIDFTADPETAINLQSDARLVIDQVEFWGGSDSMALDFKGGFGIQYLTEDLASVSIEGLSCNNMINCIHARGIDNTVTISNSSFRFCELAVSTSGLGGLTSFTIEDSLFDNNTYAGFAAAGKTLPLLSFRETRFLRNAIGSKTLATTMKLEMSDCILADNHVGIEMDDVNRDLSNVFGGTDLILRNSLFLRNRQYAVGGPARLRASLYTKCVFAYNNVAIGPKTWRIAEIASSVFMYNRLGVDRAVTNITQTTFYRNGIGCSGSQLLSESRFIENEIALKGKAETIVDCSFLDNAPFHIEMTDSESWDATHQYWGTTDVDEIRSKIFDIYQDAMLGLVTIDPVATDYFGDAEIWEPPQVFLATRIDNNTDTVPERPATLSPDASPSLPTNSSTQAPSYDIIYLDPPVSHSPTDNATVNDTSIMMERFMQLTVNLTEAKKHLEDANGHLENSIRRLEEANRRLEVANARLEEANGLLLQDATTTRRASSSSSFLLSILRTFTYTAVILGMIHFYI